jgi:hypothetical protein
MNQTSQVPSKLERAFKPTARGIVGLADDLLDLCPDSGLELDWQNDRCRVRELVRPDEILEAALPKSAFRALLARIAALCNDHRPKSVSPYGGSGELRVAGEPPAHFQATFTNTPAKQNLLLTRISGNGKCAGVPDQ